MFGSLLAVNRLLANLIDFLSLISWRQPLWLVIACQPILLWLTIRWLKKRNEQQFADKHLLPWIQVHEKKPGLNRLFSRNTAYFLSWFFFALALAEPRIPEKSPNNQDDILMNIMMVIDLSESMHANDIKPTRIRRAVLEAYDFLSIVKNARIGIIVYAARAHLYIPFTTDLDALKFYLKDLDSLQLPTRGSDAVAAIQLAKNIFVKSNNKKYKAKNILLWLTDADIEMKKTDELEIALSSKNLGDIDPYILLLSTKAGAAIPDPNGVWLEDKGQAVISAMNAILIKHLKVAKVHISQVRNNNGDWNALYKQGMRTAIPAITTEKKRWKTLYPWALLPAILLLMVALFPMNLRANKTSANIFIIFSLVFILGTGLNSGKVYAAATSDTSLSNGYRNTIFQGIESYKKAKYTQAKHYFIESVLNAPTDKERAIALHNLGNTLFQLQDYENATLMFTDALRYSPKLQASIKNQALSLALFIEKEKRRNRKMNKGNFTTPNELTPLFDLPERLPFMLRTKAVNLLKIKIPKLPKQTLDHFLGQDLNNIALLEGNKKNQEKQKQKQRKQHLNLEQARLFYVGQEEKPSTALWKRLFEIEEGFPGQLKKPKKIPGVRPW